MTSRPKPLFYIPFVCGLLSVAVLVRAVDPFFVRALRLIAFDTYQQLAPLPVDPALPVRVVDIDEKSLSVIGQWPWPRTAMAQLLTTLAAGGASAIAFDTLFTEPDRTSLAEIAKRLPPEQSGLLAAAAAGKPSNDASLATALQRTPSVLAQKRRS